jgi:DNA polymerase-4
VYQQALVHLRGKPLVVAAYATANGCVLSPSIEAKKLGIRVGMTVREARLICRDVIVRTPDPPLVRDVHVKFKKIFGDYSPTVIPKSIDEAILDFHGMEYVLKRDLTEVAIEIKKRLRTEIGEWISCSIGIGTNRFLAKTGASLKKPDGLEVIDHTRIREVYGRLTLTDLCGINKRFEARLNAAGIFNPLQFLDASADKLRYEVFHSIVGIHWYERLRGYEVDGVEFERKSFGQDYALGKKTDNAEELARILMKLCEKMGRRLRRSGQGAYGIHVAMLYADYTFWHKARKRHNLLYTTQDLYRSALLVFNSQPVRKVVTKLSVSCYDLAPHGVEQETLFETGLEKANCVSDALDSVNNKYGEYTIVPAVMMGMRDLVLDRIAFGSVKELEDMYTGH